MGKTHRLIYLEWGKSSMRGLDSVLLVKKSRGKLTLDEITDEVAHSSNQGIYAILIRAAEDTYQGWDIGENHGDVAELIPVEEFETCPICDGLTPPHTYCPNCGERWEVNDESNT